MRDASPKTIYLKDYTSPSFDIEKVSLTFRLFEDGAQVHSRMLISRIAGTKDESLFLDGEDLELKSLKIDGRELREDEYVEEEESLTIKAVPDKFELECVTWIKPQENKRLEGLYKSSSMFCTQCEAEGFRRITYYMDRPDVMSVFDTRIEADRSKYPILLSNGNEVDSGKLSDGRHFVSWHDPHPKPCYLFALVAGDLYCQSDVFIRESGRPVALEIFVDHKNSDKCDYALDALKRSMKWDEEKYGREYDLDVFMIVAVDDFNMGAMENKGLNIFNSSCVLAKPDATTDSAYLRIEAIVAHEYFHNWSGNRVTCRDWFQLSLKEGFTVYRDSQFSADTNSAGVKRIEDVNLLRTAQFAEDAGPMSHPIRPASYMEISNFYTLTVYEKGAEVVRMLNTLLGDETFRKGSDLYFERHDGQAVTTEDFVAAMSEASGRDLVQFKRWYDQGGTPVVKAKSSYDSGKKQYVLTFEQSCPATPGQPTKEPFHIPIELGLMLEDGTEFPLAQSEGNGTWVYELRDSIASVVFDDVPSRPIPSLLRGFSAPVRLRYDYSDQELMFLLANDADSFNRWDAGQTLALRVLQSLISAYQTGEAMSLAPEFIATYRSLLKDESLDRSMLCKLLMLPSEAYLVELSDTADTEAIYHARKFVRKTLVENLRTELSELYQETKSADSSLDLGFEAMSLRALHNLLLSLLSAAPNAEFYILARKQFDSAQNMTDSFGALASIVNAEDKVLADEVLEKFYERWKYDAQVMEQWFSVQSASSSYADLSHIKKLLGHIDFDMSNPNKVRSVIGAFCSQNMLAFHDVSGSGYAFLADQIITLDDMNPQIASRLLTPLTRWRKYDSDRQSLMQTQLARILRKPNLSKDVQEVLEKSMPSVS